MCNPFLGGGSREVDADTREWLRLLNSGNPDAAATQLHGWLLKIALVEAHRRNVHSPVKGGELEDIAYQATADAAMAIMAKLDTFRGESRFTTWAYSFVIHEVSLKLARHHWSDRAVHLDEEDWDRLPDLAVNDPSRLAVVAEIINLVNRSLQEALTEYQRDIFVAVVVETSTTTGSCSRRIQCEPKCYLQSSLRCSTQYSFVPRN